jgi:TorA maturation chaperone TorD
MPAHAHALASVTDRPAAPDREVQARADLYGLLAALLRAVPTLELVENLTGLAVDGADDFSKALLALRLAAREVSLPEIDDEYHALFVGLGRGELVPYGSWYLTGFLMEAPLGELRRDLERLGFARQDGVCEPEDHVAALCEVMAMLIGEAGADLDTQRTFFDRHLGSWADRFFSDLETAEAAVFYRAVGRLGQAFVALEREYFTLEI